MRIVSGVLLASLAIAGIGQAQARPQTRQGFTIGFGIGGGSASFDCDGCSSDRETSNTGYVRIGGTVRPNLIVAGEIDAWTKEQDGATLSVGSLNAVVQWYPNAAGGFFVLGGAGYGSIDVSIQTGIGTISNSRSGFAYQVGTGYDWRVSRNFSLSPYATFFATSAGDSDNFASDKVTVNVFHFGLGFTWH